MRLSPRASPSTLFSVFALLAAVAPCGAVPAAQITLGSKSAALVVRNVTLSSASPPAGSKEAPAHPAALSATEMERALDHQLMSARVDREAVAPKAPETRTTVKGDFRVAREALRHESETKVPAAQAEGVGQGQAPARGPPSGPTSWWSRFLPADMKSFSFPRTASGDPLPAKTRVPDGLPPQASVLLMLFFLVFGLFWDDAERISNSAENKLNMSPEKPGPIAGSAVWGDSRSESQQPVICPKFNKQYAKVQFAMSAVPLRSETWSGHVLGFMGTPLLSAALRRAPGSGRVLEICSIDPKESILVSVSSSLELRGPGGTWLGGLEAASSDKSCVFRGTSGRAALVMRLSAGGCYEARSIPGDAVLATATWTADGATHGHRFEVCINPGSDAILMLAVSLAVPIFCPSQRPGVRS